MNCRICSKRISEHSLAEQHTCLTEINRQSAEARLAAERELDAQAALYRDALEIGRFVLSGGWVKPSKITNGQYIAWTKEEFDGAGSTIIVAIRLAQEHEREVHAKRTAAVAAG